MLWEFSTNGTGMLPHHCPARELNRWVQIYTNKDKTEVVTPPSPPNREG